MTSHGTLAVVIKGWPRLSETFIAQELVALEERGYTLQIWSLRFPTDKKRHPLHDKVKAAVHYLPEYLHQEPLRVLRGLLQVMMKKGFWRAFGVWAQDVRRDLTRNRIRRFGQACVLAAELPSNVDAFYAHFMHTPGSVARYSSIMLGIPWGVSAHAKDIWTTEEWEKREKLSADTYGATFLATCTGFGAKHLQELADTPDRVELVYHGLDLSRFPDPPERTYQTGPLKLLSVGRLVEKKGFDRLLQALALLPTDLDWHWTHIGGGALDKAFRAQASEADLATRITWRGACDQPEVIAAMREADIFVLPSRIAKDGDRDGLPNVLMEAASQKLTILSTPVSAIPEFIDNGVHGVLSSDDPQALAEALIAMANDPAKRQDMAEASYARLRSEFLMEPGIAQLDRRLQRMLGKGA